jgi:hypothetical protein
VWSRESNYQPSVVKSIVRLASDAQHLPFQHLGEQLSVESKTTDVLGGNSNVHRVGNVPRSYDEEKGFGEPCD